jgi:hypothetical protein
MPTLEELHADGLELLGEIQLRSQTRVGDAAALVQASGETLATRAGTWLLLCRPLEEDPDLLEEVVAVHAAGLERFYDLYDSASQATMLPSSSGRFVVADATGLVSSLPELLTAERDALPWVLEDGVVVSGIREHRATLMLSFEEEPALLFSVLLAPPLKKPPSPSMFREGFEEGS